MLLALGTCTEGSTGVNIFTAIHNELVIKRGISWHNCVTFCSDNASVMMGVHNGVVAHIVKQCPSIAVIGCACHLIHLAAQKPAGELPVDIEDFLVDVYYYLEKSTKQHQNIKKCQVLCDVTTRENPEACEHRWSSGDLYWSSGDLWRSLWKFRQTGKQICIVYLERKTPDLGHARQPIIIACNTSRVDAS